jgi:hypothetical protein
MVKRETKSCFFQILFNSTAMEDNTLLILVSLVLTNLEEQQGTADSSGSGTRL